MPQKKKIVSMTLDEDVVEWLDEIAENLDMSRSEFVNMILSGGRDAKNLMDKVVDNWFDQKKTEVDRARAMVKAKLEAPIEISSQSSKRRGVK